MTVEFPNSDTVVASHPSKRLLTHYVISVHRYVIPAPPRGDPRRSLRLSGCSAPSPAPPGKCHVPAPAKELQCESR